MGTVIRHGKALAIAFWLVPGPAAAADDPKPVAYVSNQEGAVTVIDLKRLEKSRDIDVRRL